MPNIKGYNNALTDSQIAIVNENKMVEELVMRLTEEIFAEPGVDARWVSIARTHFQEGFMALNRAVFQPQRIADEHFDIAKVERIAARVAMKGTGK